MSDGKKNNCPGECGKGKPDPRAGSVGGQAVLEGVMMRAGNRVALSVRGTDGNIKTDVEEMTPPDKKHSILRLPLIRGVVNFVTMMKLSIRIMNKSVEMLGLEEEEEPSKFEKWMDKHFGKSVTAVATAIGTVLGLALSIFLFMYIPTVTSNAIFGAELGSGMRLLKSAFNGVNIENNLLQTALRLLTLPVVVGLGYEFIRYAGRHDNLLVKILSAPGLWIQRLTTKEPDEKQMEVAIRSLMAALPDDYPEIRTILAAQEKESEEDSQEKTENQSNGNGDTTSDEENA